ncbi:hypothetical protein DFH27DRAFT_606376 [Peziza echinospora]|nr:hypothetical protein DFH27DRAFT_606376 [Peziza echinospora]
MQGKTLAKMAAACTVCIVGGPALTYWLMPTPEDLFKRYNPELQKRSLAQRDAKMKEQQEFLTKLQEYSKSDKPIWQVAAEADKARREERRRGGAAGVAVQREVERQRREMEEEEGGKA